MRFLISIFGLSLLTACASSESLVRRADQLSDEMFLSQAGDDYRLAVSRSPENLEALTGLAGWYLRQGEAGRAELLLSKACHSPEAGAPSWGLYARYLDLAGNEDGANLALARCLSSFPSNEASRTALKTITSSRRIKELEQRLAKNGYDAPARKELSLEFLNLGWLSLGLKEAETLVQRRQADKEFLTKVVEHLEKDPTSEYLRIWLERLLALDYRNPKALERLSWFALEREDFWGANSLIATYLAHYPNDPLMLERGGLLSIQLGKQQEGKQRLEKAWASGRRSKLIAETLGHLALNYENNQEVAETWFENSRLLDPERRQQVLSERQLRLENQRLSQFADFYSEEAHRLAPLILRLTENTLSLGEYLSGLEYAKRLIALRPKHAVGYLLRARAELALSRIEECQKSLAQAKRLEPKNAQVYHEYASLYLHEECFDQSAYLASLTRAAELDPKPHYLEELAEAWLKKGELKKARPWYQRLVALQGEDSDAGRTLEQIERGLLEKELEAKEKSSQGNHQSLIRLGFEYRDRLGPEHPGHQRCLEAASRLEPQNAGLHVVAANAAIRVFLGDTRSSLLELARAHLETALELEPENLDALRVKAALRIWELEQPGDIQAVVEKLQRLDRITHPLKYENHLVAASQADEARVSRWFLTGKILHHKNRDPAAVDYLKAALELPSRERAAIARSLGQVSRENGDLAGAIEAYRSLIAIPNLSDYREYAIANLVIGNLYAEEVCEYPRDLGEFLGDFPGATNAEACHELASSLSQKLNRWSNLAQASYQNYIRLSTFDTHQARGQEVINRLLRLPTNPTIALRRIASLYLEAGQGSLAREILELGYRRAANHDLRGLANDLANLLVEEGRPEEAQAVWDEVLARLPNDWRAHHGVARYLFANGQIEKSLAAFERAVKLAPEAPEMLTALGFLYWKNQDPGQALRTLKRAQALDKDNLPALYYISRIELEESNLDEAVRQGKLLIDRFKQSMGQNFADEVLRNMLLDTLSILARASFRAGAIEKALEYAWEGKELDREGRFGFTTLAGDIRFLQKQYHEAADLYRGAAKSDPGNQMIRFKLAQALASSGKTEAALKLLDELYRSGKDFIRRQDVHLIYAQVLNQLGERKRAERVLESLVEDLPWLEAGYIALAEQVSSEGRAPQAIEILEKGLAHLGNSSQIRDALVWELADRGDLVRARHLALENLARHPDSAEYRASLAYVLLRQGLVASDKKTISSLELAQEAPSRPPRSSTGSSLYAASRHFSASRWAETLDLISAGEGSRALDSSETALRLIFDLLLAKSTPLGEAVVYYGAP